METGVGWRDLPLSHLLSLFLSEASPVKRKRRSMALWLIAA
jgi:hypothetical protein